VAAAAASAAVTAAMRGTIRGISFGLESAGALPAKPIGAVESSLDPPNGHSTEGGPLHGSAKYI
jgi:hypothetical protein